MHLGKFSWGALMHLALSPFMPTAVLRRTIMKVIGVNIPITSYVAGGSVIGSNKIKIGNYVGVNSYCFLDGAAEIILEDNVRLGAQVTILTGTHDIEPSVIRRDLSKGTTPMPVTIGRGSWICARVTILPGVRIGEGCVVAAGSVVNKDLQPNGLYAGVPAKLVRSLSTENDISI